MRERPEDENRTRETERTGTPPPTCIQTLIQNQPHHLPVLANTLRIDIILCRNIIKDYRCYQPVDGVGFFRVMEQIILYYQQTLPELAWAMSLKQVTISEAKVNLLAALSFYHSLILSPFFEEPNQIEFIHFYVRELRPLVQKLVHSKLEAEVDIGLTIPTSRFELPEEDV